jgi:transposase
MAKESVSDELWEVIEPLLPPEPPKPQGSALRAILLPDLALGTIQDTKRCGVYIYDKACWVDAGFSDLLVARL